MNDPENANLKNFTLAEKNMYGRVNRNYVPIELSPETPLVQIANTNEEGTTFQVIKFVGEAFKELSNQFRVKSMNGHIRSDDPFLSTLEVKRAYESPRSLYRNYSIHRKDQIINTFLSERLKFKDFDEFIAYFVPVLQNITETMPFTYPAFVKSKYCPPTTSGLVIDIADFSADDDAKKIESFKNSPNWLFYLNACRQYGFSVDSNLPYRLVADIGTSEMVLRARNTSRCRYSSTDSILGEAYAAAHKTYYDNFATILLNYYNACKRNYSEIEHCHDHLSFGIATSKFIIPVNYTLDTFNFQYGGKIMNLYLKIRLMEEKEAALTELQKKNLVNETNQLAKLKGIPAALDYFEIVLGRTYDYSGSLTDLLYRGKLRKDEEINVLSNT